MRLITSRFNALAKRRSMVWLLAVLVGTVAALVVASCGDGEKEPSLKDVGEGDVETVVAPSEGSPALEHLPDSRSGGTFRYPVGSNLIIPDPVIGFTSSSRSLFYEIYSGLTKITDDPSRPVVLDLAERYSAGDDGKGYEFVLRDGLMFSDGSPVTASDFKWSWERALRPVTGSDSALSVLGSISGAVDVADGVTDDLLGVEVVDDRTLKVNLRFPDGDFLAALATPVAYVLSRSNVEKWGIDWAKWDEGGYISGGYTSDGRAASGYRAVQAVRVRLSRKRQDRA